ncbi:carboxypeptidase N subunit 2-like isoform X2 [Corythoichthys intestinalis]|nr:carboxypeptidase N subunit 2-like isoform X2 [Corythoichthys intestinalis]XP_057713282.1 carboxypeptidase N subunit 2-like isoform X2 [Corythoichthys intestinalis]XP_061795156.1 carboxypeptidase N subunit 2-like [Nerophis lumbriciformis]
MDMRLHATLFLLLLPCPNGATPPHADCPDKCQCFTAARVLCADEHMTSLPANLSQEAVEVVVMTSALQYLFPGAFEESPQLTKLVFLNNPLRSIHSQAFRNLSELRELEISGSPWLDHLFLGTFSEQGNLTELQLNYNKFQTFLPGSFDSLERLESLQMKANVISDLPVSLFRNLRNLRVLDLSLNKIPKVEKETFSGLSAVEILKLSNNRIANISSDVFCHVPRLTELHLEGNGISRLADGVFSALADLTVLNLRGNRLMSFSDTALGPESSNLTHLDLRGNRLTELSHFGTLTSLTELLLSSNELASLPRDLLQNVSALENLDLSENRLTSLPDGIFYGLKSLKIIYLQKNQLTDLDSRLFKDQEMIQQLYLSYNRLQNLPLGLLDRFALPHILRLHGNPWKCDCHLWYLHDFVLNSHRDVEMPDRVVCESPRFLRMRPLASIHREELVCPLADGDPTDLSACILRKSANSLVIRCKVEKCSTLAVQVQYLGDDGAVHEHLWKKNNSLCANITVTQAPIP